MRRLLFTSLCLTAVLLASCSKNDNAENASANLESLEVPQYLVKPGRVTGDRAGGINGTFTLAQASAADAGRTDAIPGDQLGGACIVFRAQDLGSPNPAQCTADSDCGTPQVSGYCSPEHKCWARPAAGLNDPLCKRSIETSPQTQWQVGVENKISNNPIPVAQYSLQPNAQARLIALTKGKPPHGQQLVLTWGEPTTIP